MKTNQKSQKPYAVYVIEGEGTDKAYWNRIGAAWRHEDGKGFNISLSCLPLNGQLVVREPKAKPESDAEAGR
ncbi:hypothetical protein [Bradyrhizobium sp. sGM-13]|uniref:hypothetical protein n=1 Tax=Bradyrhizobium sp. sGM-13 TaxID=2831781 RepID=UPI001BCCF6A8|nr:hypothetical protein [Bradyrhizobium sp. sGM-13]